MAELSELAEMEARAGRLRNRIQQLRIDYPEAADARRDDLAQLNREIALRAKEAGSG